MRLRDRPHLLLRRPAHDRHVDVNAARARRLRVARHLQRVERLASGSARPRRPARTWRPSPDRGRSADSRAGRCRRTARTTGSGRCSRGSRPRAAPEDPGSSGSRSRLPELVLDRARRDPGGPGRRRALHEEEVAGGTVRIALHHHGPVAQVRQQHRRHVDVVLEEIALRDARARARRACADSSGARRASRRAPPTVSTSAGITRRGARVGRAALARARRVPAGLIGSPAAAAAVLARGGRRRARRRR